MLLILPRLRCARLRDRVCRCVAYGSVLGSADALRMDLFWDPKMRCARIGFGSGRVRRCVAYGSVLGQADALRADRFWDGQMRCVWICFGIGRCVARGSILGGGRYDAHGATHSVSGVIKNPFTQNICLAPVRCLNIYSRI
jgi:hypothetical protein